MNEPRDSQTPDPEDARRDAWARDELTRKAAKLQGPCAFRPGEVWRFRDGREGVVALANVQQAVVYIGPQAFILPAGDWPAVVLGASLIRDPAPAEDPVAVETSAAVQPIESSPAPPPVVTEPEPAAEPPESWGEWAQRTSIVPYSEPEALVEEVVETPAPPAYSRDASRGRKDRKRKP